MSPSATQTTLAPKGAIFRTMATLYPWLADYVERPLQDYAERLFRPVEKAECSAIRADALDKFLECLERSALKAGYSRGAAAEIRADFAAHRVLQAGPHLMLSLDPEAYFTHAFSLLGLGTHERTAYVSYAVSTVKLEERARKGPGWLTIEGKPTSIFSLSRNQMIPYSLLARFDDLHFGTEKWSTPGTLPMGDEIRTLLPSGTFARPSHALKAANLALWPKVFGSHFSFLQIDDEDVADLCIQHLTDENSWLRNVFIADGRLATSVLMEIDALSTSPWAGLLMRSTDFFWYYHADKRLPVRLVQQHLLNALTGEKVVRFGADEIAQALAKRILIPNLFIMFLVTAILPGIRVLGGSRHPLYYPLMRYVLCRALRKTKEDESLEHELASDDLPCAWGHRVIERPELALADLLNGDHAWLQAIFSRHESLEVASGAMSGFRSDPRWIELTRQIATHQIAISDGQWAYSGRS